MEQKQACRQLVVSPNISPGLPKERFHGPEKTEGVSPRIGFFDIRPVVGFSLLLGEIKRLRPYNYKVLHFICCDFLSSDSLQMAAGSSGPQNFRKAIATIKDSTSVGMAKVNSEYKDLSVSILKATNHVEILPKEKHVRTILGALSGSRPRADVSYCIYALTRRLAKTHTWVVALKTLIVIHRALREVDHSFCEEMIYHNKSRGHLVNLLHFKDDSTPSAWDYSNWIRAYALYIEECLECFRVIKYDFHRDYSRTKRFGTSALLEHLPALQQLLFRLLSCMPVGAARYNFMIQYALSIVAAESVRLYVAITDGVVILIDKFFEMQRHGAVRALEIYRKSGEQAQVLSAFFDMCQALGFGRRQKYVKIEQPPASFLTAMEEYVKEAPQTLMLPWRDDDDGGNTPKIIAVPADDLQTDDQATIEEGIEPSADSQITDKSYADSAPLIPDLLSWDELSPQVSESEETSPNLPTAAEEVSSEPASWELALVETSSDAASAAPSKAFVLDRSTLDSLYDVALAKPNTDGPCQMANNSSNPFEADGGYDPQMVYDPSLTGHQNFMQMAGMFQQQAALLQNHHHDQSVIGYDYMQLAGIARQQLPFVEQRRPPSQESSFAGQNFMQTTQVPQCQVSMQQQEKSFAALDPSNPFGNPFTEQGASLGALQNQFLELELELEGSQPCVQDDRSFNSGQHISFPGAPQNQSSILAVQDSQSDPTQNQSSDFGLPDSLPGASAQNQSFNWASQTSLPDGKQNQSSDLGSPDSLPGAPAQNPASNLSLL